MKLESMLTTGEIMSGSLQDEIKQLKDEKNAIILAHNYQPKEIQEIADFLGDSLELCMKAAEIEDKDLVIFCGVDFMAETAYILNQDKKIVIPDLEAECPMAHMLPEDELLKAKEEHPNVKVLSHPECSKEVRDLSDYIGSTSGIINYATECEDKEFIIATEEGVLHQLKKKNPDKKFYFPEVMVCPNMKKTSLQDVYDALDGKKEEVILDEEIRKKALTSLENMHKLV